jgi:hypothetical protein
MSGQLNISIPNGGGLVFPFALSSSGTAAANRGISFQFNLPQSGLNALGAEIIAAREGASANSFFSFSTHNGTAVTEAMRITSSGNVGIGTNAPGFKLDVNGSANFRGGSTWFRQSTGLAGGEGAAISTGATVNNEATFVLSVYRAGVYTSRLYVNQFGQMILQPNNDFNVGIGVASPSHKLDVSGNVNVSGGLCIVGDCKTSWSQVGGSQWSLNSTNLFYNGGNVGIGTNTPATKLDVVGTVRAGNADTNVGNHPTYGTAYSGFWRQGTDYALLTNGTNTYLNAPVGAGGIYFRSGNTDKMFVNGANGNVGIGTVTPSTRLHVVGDVTVTGNIAAKYQDIAEWVEASDNVAAGTVMVLDSSTTNRVMASERSYDTRVAGVVSSKPGLMLGESGDNKILVATTGRVKVRVDAAAGPIEVGDLLVTSDVPGHAMKSQPIDVGGVKIHRPGTLIGKALEPLRQGTGEILVLLSLQ